MTASELANQGFEIVPLPSTVASDALMRFMALATLLITWLKVTQDTTNQPIEIKGYRVYECVGSKCKKLASVTRGTSYSVKNVKPGLHKYGVSAVSKQGIESTMSLKKVRVK